MNCTVFYTDGSCTIQGVVIDIYSKSPKENMQPCLK